MAVSRAEPIAYTKMAQCPNGAPRARHVPDRRDRAGDQRVLTDNPRRRLTCDVMVNESMTVQFPS